MIITCPHCRTRYQVAYEAIGAAGRKVQCASCARDWQARPGEPEPEPPSEEALDAALSAEEKKVAAELAMRLAAERARADAAAAPAPPPPDAAEQRRRQSAFRRRRRLIGRDLPLARMRRGLRIAVWLALGGLVVGGYAARVPIVTYVPAMAGVYAAFGIGVNVVGLDFADLRTTRAVREGRELLTVTAQIVGLSGRPVPVPPVLVTLTDEAGAPIYQWSVTPPVHSLAAGESVRIETRLSAPPAAARGVRLGFGTGRAGGPAATTSMQGAS